MFISSGHDLVFYDALTYKVVHRYSPKKASKIRQASWSRDNNFLVYLADGSKPIILACRYRDKIRSIVEVNLDLPYTSVTFPRTTKKTLGIGTETGELLTYNTKTGSKVPIHFEPFPDVVRIVDYNANDKVIAGAGDSCVRIYDSARGMQPEMIRALGSKCTAMRFHPHHAHTLAVATEDGTVFCLDVTTNSAVYEIQCHKEPVAAIAFSHRTNSKSLITVSTDNKYAIHSIMDKNIVQCGHLPHGLTALDVSDDRNSMLVGTELGQVYQYDLRYCLTPVTSFKAHKSPVLCLRYANDMITGDGLVRCGSAATGSAAGMSSAREGDVNGSTSGGAVDKYLTPAASASGTHLGHNSVSTMASGAVSGVGTHFDTIQERILRDMGTDMLELSALMTAQMGNLQLFIKQEVDKVDAQNHDKWELLIAAAASSGDSCVGGGKSCCSSAQAGGGGGAGSVMEQRLTDGNNEPESGDLVQHRPFGGSQI